MDNYLIKLGIGSLANAKLFRVEYDIENAKVDGRTMPTTIDYALDGSMITSRGIPKRVRSFVILCRRLVDPDNYGTLEFLRSIFYAPENTFYFQDIDGQTTYKVGLLNIGDFEPSPIDALFLGESSLWRVKVELREQ